MSETTPPPESSEPATGPVLTPPPAQPDPPMYQPPAAPIAPESHRLNKAAAWVGIVAGSLIVVAVIFGTGFFVGKEVGESRGGFDRGHHMVLRPAAPMIPMGPRDGFERGPGFPGPFGPGDPGGQGDAPSPGRP
ncbi:MAG: hypothetical protein SW019_12780 [Actinomycetota bacterium]|nr:hypothetical protein [Actinomycetota bacterium]